MRQSTMIQSKSRTSSTGAGRLILFLLLSCSCSGGETEYTFSFENGTLHEQDVFREGVRRVERACGVSFREELRSDTVHVKFDDEFAKPGTNYIGMYDRERGLPTAITLYGGCRTDDATILECSMHELGHHLGGEHVDASAIMAPFRPKGAGPLVEFTMVDVIEVCILKELNR